MQEVPDVSEMVCRGKVRELRAGRRVLIYCGGGTMVPCL